MTSYDLALPSRPGLHPALGGDGTLTALATASTSAGLPPTDLPRLAEAARRLAASAPRWRPLLGAAPGRTRLAWTAELELWLVTWAPGAVTRAHDHGGAAVALTVLDGALVEDCLDATIWTTCRRTTFRAGSTTAFAPGHVHRLAAAGGAPAASVHAWSPRWPGGLAGARQPQLPLATSATRTGTI
ncbi:MAG TPA: cysteine dioxygenase [Actinomycetes bacterium]